MAEKLVTLPAVAGAHGIGGEVRLKLFANDIESLKRHRTFDAGGRMLSLKSIRPDTGEAVARFAGVRDRSADDKLRGTVLAVASESRPPAGAGESYNRTKEDRV